MIQNFFLLSFLLISWVLSADAQYNLDAAALYNRMLSLKKTGTVLYVAAHPDDENTRLISYLVGEAHLRTAYLSLTRGDGGQNLIGSELGDQLGLIRTQELLAARQVDGAEQYFSRAVDFGYSKTPEETLDKWGTEEILSDFVHLVRELKPDMIVCRFPASGEGGHGHHTASAILADMAYEAAADPSRFPASVKAFGTWQPSQLLWNTFNFGTVNTIADDQLKIDIGNYNPLLGKGYGEIASLSRSMHKSQGFGAAIGRGEQLEYFKLLRGQHPGKDLFTDAGLTWQRFGREGEQISRKVDAVINNFNFTAPDKSIAALVALKKDLQSVKTSDKLFAHYLQVKSKDIEKLILNCAGFDALLYTSQSFALEGEMLHTEVSLISPRTDQLKVISINYPAGKDTVVNATLGKNKLLKLSHTFQVQARPESSTAYWLQTPGNGRIHSVSDFGLIGRAWGDPPLRGAVIMLLGNDTLSIPLELKYRHVDPIRGELHEPVYILPEVFIKDLPAKLLFVDSQPRDFTFRLYNNKPGAKGILKMDAGNNYKVEPAELPYLFNSKGESRIFTVRITPAEKSIAAADNKDNQMQSTNNKHATLRISADGRSFISQELISYNHIPTQAYIRDAIIDLDNYSIATGQNTRVAYITGAGDRVAESLQEAGYEVDQLDAFSIGYTDLSKYQAIVTGIRAFNVSEELFGVHDKLMHYVEQGGNLIVQYNTNSRVGPLKGNIGPYPFTISRDRITEEDAQVEFIDPADPVVNYPNKLTKADFEDWVQERGIYFVSEYDPAYRTVFSMQDTNEAPKTGSTIIGRYGKGNFVYTGLVFFRQLPAGVPGAYRLMSNLINLPPNG